MSEHDVSAASEAGAAKPAASGKPSLFDRLRALFGIGEASIDLREELLLQDQEHEQRRADDRDGDGARGEQRDAKSEAHASRIT